MKTVVTLEEVFAARLALPEPVGLVPTMGFLHQGHISLVETSLRECASTVVSIFVNPSQFGPGEDLAAYPRDLPRDLAMLEKAGADLVWTPTPEGMYPSGYQTWVTVEEIARPLEGAIRPHHFRGVATVVAKLFNAVRPSRAYFGQKDAQQVAVIARMARDLNYPLQVVACPTVREADGLAMSSRNTYLSPAERSAATVLYRSLLAANSEFHAGIRDTASLRQAMLEVLEAEPLARVQYVSFADPFSLAEIDQIENTALVSMAVSIGRTRLIDNMIL